MLFPEFKHIGSEEVLSVVTGLLLLLLIIHYFRAYWPAAVSRPLNEVQENQLVPVSVIICARNEDENLTEYLPQVLTQDYPEFEVIVVNDCSWDNTENVIDEFAKIFPNLRKVNIKEDAYYKHGKKFAVMVGIKGARYEHLLLTDADCFPASTQWLRKMANGFQENAEIVLGYGAYSKSAGLLNKLIRFDAFVNALHYLSSALRHKPYMGVGRNLAYKKELFFRHKGFSSHYHVTSGDDDLFVNEAATATNTAVCAEADAMTFSKAKENFKDWLRQKRRHLTTAPHYNFNTQMTLAYSYLLKYMFYLSWASLLFMKSTLLIAGGIFLIKIGIQMLIMNKASAKFKEKDLWGLSFILELLLLFIYPIFHFSKLINKPNKWTN